jgi:hypothetical protein
MESHNPNVPNHQPGYQYSYQWLLYQLNITSGIITHITTNPPTS